MNRELAHTVRFVTEEVADDPRKAGYEFGSTEPFEVPLPRPRDTVTFSTAMEGEQPRTHYTMSELYDGDVEYEKSKRFEVVSIDTHYEDYRLKEEDSSDLHDNKLKIRTTVTIRPASHPTDVTHDE